MEGNEQILQALLEGTTCWIDGYPVKAVFKQEENGFCDCAMCDVDCYELENLSRFCYQLDYAGRGIAHMELDRDLLKQAREGV